MSREEFILLPLSLTDLFDDARKNPRNPMNEPGRLTGRYCIPRQLRAQAKRRNGRVKANVSHRAGRAVYQP